MLFPDDVTLIAHSEEVRQTRMAKAVDELREFGLTFSLKKNNIMVQDVSKTTNMAIGLFTLEAVQDFTYLSSTITRNVSLDVKLNKRIGREPTVMAR